MRLYVAVTDNEWFALHASKNKVEEVNFWHASPNAGFKALHPGELLLFKLHAPDNFIAGGGFFTRFLQLPLKLVWEAFGEANGVANLLDGLVGVTLVEIHLGLERHEDFVEVGRQSLGREVARLMWL